MKYRVSVSDDAVEHIDNITQYITHKFGMPDTALKKADLIWSEIWKLEEQPSRGFIWPDDPWRQRNLHCLLVDHYKIMYTIDDSAHYIEVLAIFHQLQNANQQLNKLL